MAANERKSRLWQSFAARLNAVHGHEHPWTAIREKWGQLVSAAKKAHRCFKAARAGTEGGVQPPPVPPHLQKVLDVYVGTIRFNGIPEAGETKVVVGMKRPSPHFFEGKSIFTISSI